MNAAHQLRPILSAVADRVFEAAVTWVKKTPMAYKIRNRQQFSNLQGHEMMLADRKRVDAYAAALPRIIKPTDVVLDLGTGTGVLAFLAARAGARSIHAVEHSPIINVAERVAKANDVTNIVFHQVHSSLLRLEQPVDVLVHEQMGNALFEERMVTNIADLRDRILKPGGAIVPSHFEFFVEPVCVKAPYVVPFIWQQNLDGIDYTVLRDSAGDQPAEYRRIGLNPDRLDLPLTRPSPALRVDLRTISPRDLPTVLELERIIESAGTVHGLGVWFRAFLDDTSIIDVTPFGRSNSSWLTPLLRLEEPLAVVPGDRLRIRLETETLEALDTWSWTVRRAEE